MNRRTLSPAELASAAALKSIFNSKKKELGLTQQTAAFELGWSAAAVVNQYLNGKIPLNLEAGLKFARLLKVQPSDINPEWEEYDNLRDTTPQGVRNYKKLLTYVDELDDEDYASLEAMVEAYYQSKKAKE